MLGGPKASQKPLPGARNGPLGPGNEVPEQHKNKMRRNIRHEKVGCFATLIFRLGLPSVGAAPMPETVDVRTSFDTKPSDKLHPYVEPPFPKA